MKKTLAILYFCTFLTLQFVFAQKPEFAEIDEHVRSTPDHYTSSVEELSAYLSSTAKNKEEIIRSFYVWIAENIDYDVKALSIPGQTRIKPEDVLQKKKAVCEGYSILFKAFCDEANIKCYVIPGYSKGYGYRRGKKFIEEDHAWNAVYVNDDWHLIDVTWGAGGISFNKTFKRAFNEKYFMPSKEFFLTEHLPISPAWQLVDCPISLDVFEKDSDQVIKEISKNKKPCLDYKKEIEKLEAVPDLEREIYEAEIAYKFNPQNHRFIGYAYMKKGFLLAVANSSNELPLNQRLESEQKVLEFYERAIDYLKKSKSPETKNLILNCNHNIAISKTNIKTLKRALGM